MGVGRLLEMLLQRVFELLGSTFHGPEPGPRSQANGRGNRDVGKVSEMIRN